MIDGLFGMCTLSQFFAMYPSPSLNNQNTQRMSNQPKLLIVPGYCDGLGGTLVSLSLLIEGFRRCNQSNQLCVLVRSGSTMEQYLRQVGQDYAIQIIEAEDQVQFFDAALQWVKQQPKSDALLLDNCVWKGLLPILLKHLPELRFNGRLIYHFCHDLATSYNWLGNFSRTVVFKYLLCPQVLCNSRFTANYVKKTIGQTSDILYQPVDLERFNQNTPKKSPPENLKAILQTGARVILAPSRINDNRIVNDKNLRALIPIVAELKARGYAYHGVLIGEDRSEGQLHTQAFLNMARQAGIADQFSILPPTFAIEDYYNYADVVVTLAPREPFGRTVVEAIACGVPVIGSHTGGIGEILQHFAPDWMVDPYDPISAVQAILNVAQSTRTADTLLQGRQWVESHCSVIRYAQQMMLTTGLTSCSFVRS